MAVQFDAALHRYAVDGLRYRSVTGLLRAAGRTNGGPWFTAQTASRGHNVHALTAAVDVFNYWPGAGVVIPWPAFLPPPPQDLRAWPDEPDAPLSIVCPDALAGYVDAYWRWRDMYRPRYSHIEVPLARRDWRVAGTPDRIGVVLGALTVVDIKAAVWSRYHGLQLAGYALLHCPQPVIKRMALYLQVDGRFRVHPFEDPHEYTEFAALATDAGYLALSLDTEDEEAAE